MLNKISIVTSRKIGEPNYGSRGATVGLEMEVDSRLVEQPRELHAQIARLFRLAKASVDRELSRSTDERVLNSSRIGRTDEVLRVRPATAAQIRAIRAIARRHNLDLTEQLQNCFGVGSPEELSLEAA